MPKYGLVDINLMFHKDYLIPEIENVVPFGLKYIINIVFE